MSLHIGIDVRRINDFGIGTYIRNLVKALGAVDPHNHYTLIIAPADLRELPSLPSHFEIATYGRSDDDAADHIAFPAFLRQIPADLFHIPLNRVPLLMRTPYVVTIHDMASLLDDQGKSWRNSLRQYFFRRGLLRADTVIAVSASTRRDIENLMGVPRSRIRLVYSAPSPAFFVRTGAEAQERERILERYQIQYPFLLYAGAIRPQKNIPRLVEAFAIARTALADHPQYKDLRLIIVGDEITRYTSVRQAVMKSRVEDAVRIRGFVPFGTLRVFSAAAPSLVLPSRHCGS